MLILDQDENIVACNNAAAMLGFSRDHSLGAYLELSEPLLDLLRFEPEKQLHKFRFSDGEKTFQVFTTIVEQQTCLWLVDRSEQLALGEQLRQLKRPENSIKRQMQQQIVTAMGYSELLEVVMGDCAVLSPEQVSSVQHYQGEIARNLHNLSSLLEGKRAAPAGKGTVLVAERHRALAELISELLRTEGYRVVVFSEGSAALEYYAVDGDSVDILLVDDQLLAPDGQRLIDTMMQSAPALRCFLLSDRPGETVQRQDGTQVIGKPVDFNRLLAALSS